MNAPVHVQPLPDKKYPYVKRIFLPPQTQPHSDDTHRTPDTLFSLCSISHTHPHITRTQQGTHPKSKQKQNVCYVLSVERLSDSPSRSLARTRDAAVAAAVVYKSMQHAMSASHFVSATRSLSNAKSAGLSFRRVVRSFVVVVVFIIVASSKQRVFRAVPSFSVCEFASENQSGASAKASQPSN